MIFDGLISQCGPNEALHRTAVSRFGLALEFFFFIRQSSAVGELIRSTYEHGVCKE